MGFSEAWLSLSGSVASMKRGAVRASH